MVRPRVGEHRRSLEREPATDLIIKALIVRQHRLDHIGELPNPDTQLAALESILCRLG
jgi:hypothetical protein